MDCIIGPPLSGEAIGDAAGNITVADGVGEIPATDAEGAGLGMAPIVAVGVDEILGVAFGPAVLDDIVGVAGDDEPKVKVGGGAKVGVGVVEVEVEIQADAVSSRNRLTMSNRNKPGFLKYGSNRLKFSSFS